MSDVEASSTARRLRGLLARALPWLLLAISVAIVVTQAARPVAILNMWRPWGEIGALAAVMTAIILTGGIDLSVGSIVALCGVVLGVLWKDFGWPIEAAAGAALATGVLGGALNGGLVALGVAPLVATLSTMALYAGLAMALSRGQRVSGIPASFTRIGQGTLAGLPQQFWLAAVVLLAAWVVVHHTRWGRYFYAIGDNRLAARFAAVPVRQVEWSLYVASGFVAALVALAGVARGGAVVPTAGSGIELQTIACVVVGGTRVNGGAGSVCRTILGLAILSLLDIGLQFLSRTMHLPGTDLAWHFNANARLLLIGILVIGVAVVNERLAGRER